MFISQLSATEFPKSYDGFMNETNGPIFSLFFSTIFFSFFTQILFVIIYSRLVQKQALGLADMLQTLSTLSHTISFEFKTILFYI